MSNFDRLNAEMQRNPGVNRDARGARLGNNHGGIIVCAWCGRPTAQTDQSALGDSSGICQDCADQLRFRANLARRQ